MHYRGNRRWSPAAIVMVVLLVIGLLTVFRANPTAVLIPAAIFGIVFLLYKFPPARLRRLFSPGAKGYRPYGRGAGPAAKPKTSRHSLKSKRKKTPALRVIQGGEQAKRRDDDLPKYH